MDKNISKRLRFLETYCAAVTLALGGLIFSGFIQDKTMRLDQLDVGRINIVEKDGKLKMAISNKELAPDPILKGKSYPLRSGGNGAGIIFFNDAGDECGGLTYSGSEKNGKSEAGALLAFDQFNQDQTVGIQYSDNDGRRFAGLKVWDRSNTPLAGVVEKMMGIRAMKDGPEKTAALKEFQERAKQGDFGALRLVVGKEDPDKSAEIVLNDPKGKPRLKISVDGDGTPKLDFMDAEGKVFYSLPDNRK